MKPFLSKIWRRFSFVELSRKIEKRVFDISQEISNSFISVHPHFPWSDPDFLLSDFPEVCSDLDTMVTKASKGPYLLVEQEEITQSDVDDHCGLQVRYSSENPSFVDCEANAVDERCLKEYRTFFHIPSEVVFRLPGGNAAWNPPQGCMAEIPLSNIV